MKEGRSTHFIEINGHVYKTTSLAKQVVIGAAVDAMSRTSTFGISAIAMNSRCFMKNMAFNDFESMKKQIEEFTGRGFEVHSYRVVDDEDGGRICVRDVSTGKMKQG